ncbi:MAG: GGDEF domain-containing protein [Candidatus Pacearchaeota archaeon]|nr:GGDEF domain-containing protein [Candidatus Pacearchaeota archaeon]
MVELKRLEKSLYVVVALIMIAVVFFSSFSYIAIKTNINLIRGAILTISGMFSGEFINTLTKITNSVSSIYYIVVVELIALGGGLVASLLAIGYMVNIYFNIRKKTFIDELTGVYNKRALHKILEQEIKRASRFRHPLTIMMIDIDFFKKYNDNNGHLAGDLLLQKVAKIIQNKIREVDSLARFGGEEFVVILPETSYENAIRIGERIRKAVANNHFPGEEKQPNKNITVSIGLATFHGEYKNSKHLLASADELLYQAKESGRNKIIRAYYG